MTQPVLSIKTYALVWLALLALVAITTLIALLDLGPFTMIIAITIAAMKAMLVLAFFMHALSEDKVIRIVLAGGVLWFFIMITLTVSDFVSRGWLPFRAK